MVEQQREGDGDDDIAPELEPDEALPANPGPVFWRDARNQVEGQIEGGLELGEDGTHLRVVDVHLNAGLDDAQDVGEEGVLHLARGKAHLAAGPSGTLNPAGCAEIGSASAAIARRTGMRRKVNRGPSPAAASTSASPRSRHRQSGGSRSAPGPASTDRAMCLWEGDRAEPPCFTSSSTISISAASPPASLTPEYPLKTT